MMDKDGGGSSSGFLVVNIAGPLIHIIWGDAPRAVSSTTTIILGRETCSLLAELASYYQSVNKMAVLVKHVEHVMLSLRQRHASSDPLPNVR
eukprot:scaffold83872_cov18-Prasinocladus_malaysianus.AAC.2